MAEKRAALIRGENTQDVTLQGSSGDTFLQEGLTTMASIPDNRKLPKRESDLFKSILVSVVSLRLLLAHRNSRSFDIVCSSWSVVHRMGGPNKQIHVSVLVRDVLILDRTKREPKEDLLRTTPLATNTRGRSNKQRGFACSEQ